MFPSYSFSRDLWEVGNELDQACKTYQPPFQYNVLYSLL